MKSEILLAFNEIAEARSLPRDTVMEALRSALISAYRRDVGASSAQSIDAELDSETGQLKILAEKEVVDSVQDSRTEIALSDARDLDPNIQMGDMIMASVGDVRHLGRIAAQTAKQVILQHIREAEREAQYEEYVKREGDIINGTVQSVSSHGITIGLGGRIETVLPRWEQMPGERYKPHDKVRAYVLEVKKTPRGPEIIVSRKNKNMLRRLLEYEVPEIYNGQVEIKSIAREAGVRSKVAVAALQEGVDPVGACVGMRGVRIQSIVRELNDEKIDVIEWNPDPAAFIAKALSPAHVTGVYLLDNEEDDNRTALVIVPDDQLSLAIGREGLNARLSAKLTHWRIDIKSLSQAMIDNLAHLDAGLMPGFEEKNEEIVQKMREIMTKKEEKRPIMPEEFQSMARFVELSQKRIIKDEMARRAAREKARESVPEIAYDIGLEALDTDDALYEALVVRYETIGDLMEQMAFDAEAVTQLDGVTEADIDIIQAALGRVSLSEEPVEVPPLTVEAEPEDLEHAVEEAQEPEDMHDLQHAEELTPAAAAALDAVPMPEGEFADDEEALPAFAEPDAPVPVVGEVVEGEEAPPVVLEPMIDEMEEQEEEEKPKKPRRRGRRVVIEEEEEEEGDEEQEELERKRQRRRSKSLRRELVYDEDLGEVVARRRRKPGRDSEEDWEDLIDI